MGLRHFAEESDMENVVNPEENECLRKSIKKISFLRLQKTRVRTPRFRDSANLCVLKSSPQLAERKSHQR